MASAGKPALYGGLDHLQGTLPIEYATQEFRPSKRFGDPGRCISQLGAPFALGDGPEPTSAADRAVRATPRSHDELQQRLSQAVDGSRSRITAAFAKHDAGRQGVMAPQDFAAALRDLGVPVTSQPLPSSSLHLSRDTVDYLSFVDSLEPHLGLAAAAAAARGPSPPPSSTPAQRRLFGEHSNAFRSQVELAAPTPGSPEAAPVTPGSPGAHASPPLHEHGAFRGSAGLEGERHGVMSGPGLSGGRKQTETGRLQMSLAERATRVLDAPDPPLSPSEPLEQRVSASGLVDGAAGVAVTIGEKSEFPPHRRRSYVGSSPALRSNADRLIFGRDLDGSEAEPPNGAWSDAPPTPRRNGGWVDSDDGGMSLKGLERQEVDDEVIHRSNHVRPLPHVTAQADEVIFGHSQGAGGRERSESVFSEAPAFQGAAGLVSSELNSRNARLTAAGVDGMAEPKQTQPQALSSVDTLVFGRDIDQSDTATPRREIEALRHAGAAGQLKSAQHRGEGKRTGIPTTAATEDQTVAGVLMGWGAPPPASSSRPTSSRKAGPREPPGGTAGAAGGRPRTPRDTVASGIRFESGAPTRRTNLLAAPRTVSGAAGATVAGHDVRGEPARGGARGGVRAAAAPAGPAATAGATAGAAAAAAGGEQGFKVLRMKGPTPRPSPSAVGRQLDMTPRGRAPVGPASSTGGVAAGCASCGSLTSAQRMYAGQLSLTGGLG